MSVWKAKLLLADIFHNDSLDLEEKAENIRSRLTPIGKQIAPDDDELDFLIDELVDAGVQGDVAGFDEAWNGIYDWADDNRVWIVTR